MGYFNLPFSATFFFVVALVLVAILGYLDHLSEAREPLTSMFYAFGWGTGFTISTLLYYLAVVFLAINLA